MGKGVALNEIQETEAQKLQLTVAMEQWQLYKNDLQQYEDIFMDKVDDLNNESEYGKLAGTAALGTALNPLARARAGLADSYGGWRRGPDQRQSIRLPCQIWRRDQALSQTEHHQPRPVKPAR